LPQQSREKVFRAEDERANFTSFSGVDGVTVREGKLVFTLAKRKATLGWGHAFGRQRVDRIRDMWQELNVVRLRVRQASAGTTNWTARLWRDGKPLAQR